MSLHRFAAIILPEVYYLAGLFWGSLQGLLTALQTSTSACQNVECSTDLAKNAAPDAKQPAPAKISDASSTKTGVALSAPTIIPATPEQQQPSTGPKTPVANNSSAGAKISAANAEATTVDGADIDGALQALWFGTTPEAAKGSVH